MAKKKAARKVAKKKTTKKKISKKKASSKKVSSKKASKKKVVKKTSVKKTTAKKKAIKKVAVKKTTVKKKSAKKKVATKATAAGKIYKGVQLGQKVTDFTLPYTGGGEVSIKDLLGKKVVLFFYPKDSTPGCTLEGQDFTRLKSQFKANNTEVLGVSRDSMKSHEKFKTNQNYTIELISDEQEKLCRIFDVIQKKKLYGREYEGIERSTFVIDESGALEKEWRKVKVPGHADEVLEYIKTTK